MTRIRRARPADLPVLRTIQRRALAEPWPGLLEAGVDGPLSAVVVDVGQPVGYAIVVAGTSAYLPELAVHPDHQNRGHGSALLSTLVDCLSHEHAELRVTVRVVDERARTFYERHGFERRDRISDHFESGDGLVLVRELSGLSS